MLFFCVFQDLQGLLDCFSDLVSLKLPIRILLVKDSLMTVELFGCFLFSPFNIIGYLGLGEFFLSKIVFFFIFVSERIYWFFAFRLPSVQLATSFLFFWRVLSPFSLIFLATSKNLYLGFDLFISLRVFPFFVLVFLLLFLGLLTFLSFLLLSLGLSSKWGYSYF